MTITDQEVKARLIWKAGDLRARALLNKLGMRCLKADQREAMCSLYHAEIYLSDRLAYELAPWPKNMIRESVEAIRTEGA